MSFSGCRSGAEERSSLECDWAGIGAGQKHDMLRGRVRRKEGVSPLQKERKHLRAQSATDLSRMSC